MNIPVLAGGAAVNQSFIDRIRILPGGEPYAGGVYYCNDAFDALKALDKLAAPENLDLLLKADRIIVHPSRNPTAIIEEKVKTARIPKAPFWGHKPVYQIPLDDLFASINRSALFQISWGATSAKGEKWQKYQGEFSARLEAMRTALAKHPWLNAAAVYGYYPCQSDGNDLILYNPRDNKETTRFALPRQQAGQNRCLSDYFAPLESGRLDVAALQIVSMGAQAVEYVHALQESGSIVEAFYHHGLAVQLTEAAAVWMHQRIRNELGLPPRQGKRYSWGYPAIPDLSQHQLLFKRLPAEDVLGIHLTSAFQFIPEYTTAALIVHHPQATYFRME